jgi:hypothetical protein
MRFIETSFDWATCIKPPPVSGGAIHRSGWSQAGAIARRQRAVVQLSSEVAPVHVSDHLAMVAARGQEFARELVHRTGLRARNLDGAIQRRCERQLGQVGDHGRAGVKREISGWEKLVRQQGHLSSIIKYV